MNPHNSRFKVQGSRSRQSLHMLRQSREAVRHTSRDFASTMVESALLVLALATLTSILEQPRWCSKHSYSVRGHEPLAAPPPLAASARAIIAGICRVKGSMLRLASKQNAGSDPGMSLYF